MSLSGASNFVAGDDDLTLDELFSFSNSFDAAAASLSPPADDLLASSLLASPFVRPLEDLQGQPVGWFSPSVAGPADSSDAINFDDFLALDENTDDLPAPVQERIPSPPPELAAPSTPKGETAAPAAAENTEGLRAVTDLATANAEITRLQGLLAARSPQSAPMTPPVGRQDSGSSSSPRKRKFTVGEVSPPKKQATKQMGPIEAMWSPAVTKDERGAFQVNSVSPTTPSPPDAHLEFLAQTSAPYKTSEGDFEISPEDLQSMQEFLRDNSDLIQGSSHQVTPTTTVPNNNMAPHTVNMKAKRAPLKRAPRSSPNSTDNTATKIVKKPKASPKKTQHQRTTSTISNITSPSVTSARHRSIDELLALNFYSLNEQEKCRVLLPMLRSLDPRELEASLAELPCIQAKGVGHEVRVAKAIQDSPPTPEADAELAVKLTTGTLPSPTPVRKASHSSSPAPQASPLQQTVITSIEASEDHGATRQREALEKAALLQAHGKKR